MSKSSPGLFGSSRTGAVTIVDAPVRLTYARKARLTFWVVSIAISLLAGTVAAHYLHPIVGALVGVLAGLAVGLVCGLLVLAWPVLRALWHWADAILTATVLVYGWTALMSATNLTVSLLVVAALTAPMLMSSVRRTVMALVWCAIVRHRLRLSFARMVRPGASQHSGCLPLILLARPTPAGERVWVWLRPGLAMPAVEAELAQLAVNCLADQVRVCRASRRYAAFIRVDITRRDPLRATVLSPLPGQIDFDTSAIPVSPGLPAVGLDLPDVPEPVDQPRKTGGRPTRQPRGSQNPTPPTDSGDPDDDPNSAFI